MYIIRPDVEDAEMQKVVERMSEVVTTAGATDVKAEVMGKKRLAYEVKKYSEGFYVLLNFASEPEAVTELERIIKISDDVIRYLTTRKE
jgi:small subunit ribosomal protein S6